MNKQQTAVEEPRVNSRGKVIRGWFRSLTDHDRLIAAYLKKHPEHRKILRRHKIICNRLRSATRNLAQGYVSSDYRKGLVARVERVQERLMEAGVPAKVITSHHKLHTSW